MYVRGSAFGNGAQMMCQCLIYLWALSAAWFAAMATKQAQTHHKSNETTNTHKKDAKAPMVALFWHLLMMITIEVLMMKPEPYIVFRLLILQFLFFGLLLLLLGSFNLLKTVLLFFRLYLWWKTFAGTLQSIYVIYDYDWDRLFVVVFACLPAWHISLWMLVAHILVITRAHLALLPHPLIVPPSRMPINGCICLHTRTS